VAELNHPGLKRAALMLAALAALSGCSGFAPVATPTPRARAPRVPPSATPTPTPTPSPATTPPPATPTTPPALHVVGLGDSVMAGTRCGCRGLVEEYAAALGRRTGRPVRVTNLGSDGAVTGDLLHALAGDRRTRTAVAGADVVVVTIGANDLLPQRAAWQTSGCGATCYESAARAVGRRLARVLHALAVDRGGRTDHVLVTDYWNVFRDGQVALDSDGADERAWSVRVTAAANREICGAARAQAAACVDLVAPFKGRGHRDPTPLLADDGDHPNAAGVRAIVAALLAATPSDL
jgi:lysophospholipase L1-like esterase